jgi:hypothetical protein
MLQARELVQEAHSVKIPCEVQGVSFLQWIDIAVGSEDAKPQAEPGLSILVFAKIIVYVVKEAPSPFVS